MAAAILANIAYQSGTYLFSFVGNATLAVVLSIVWGLVILGTLILRVRNVLHVGLMEAALERSARDGGIGQDGDLQFCGQCEMPLLDHAAFCNACGTTVRVQSKVSRPKVPAMATAASGASIVPGFDSPVAGEESEVTAAEGSTTAVGETSAGVVEQPDAGPAPAAPRRTDDAARDRFYDDEEGRA